MKDFNFYLGEIKKSIKDNTLDYFKKKLFAILNEQEKLEEAQNSKNLDHLEKSMIKTLIDVYGLQKGTNYPIGTVREWKGEKYRKIAPGKWRKIYDSNTRGARQSIRMIKSKIINAKSTDELLEIVMQNVNRFQDADGNLLPIVEELKKEVNKKKLELNSGKPSTQQQIDDFKKEKEEDLKDKNSDKKTYRYYLKYRPASIGTHPSGAINIHNFEDKQDDGSGVEAWGYVEYDHPLTQQEQDNFELVDPKGKNVGKEKIEEAKNKFQNKINKLIKEDYNKALKAVDDLEEEFGNIASNYDMDQKDIDYAVDLLEKMKKYVEKKKPEPKPEAKPVKNTEKIDFDNDIPERMKVGKFNDVLKSIFDYANEQENADPKVMKLFQNMKRIRWGTAKFNMKTTSKKFKREAFNLKVYGYSREVFETSLMIDNKKITDENKLFYSLSTFHEIGHMMAFYGRTDRSDYHDEAAKNEELSRSISESKITDEQKENARKKIAVYFDPFIDQRKKIDAINEKIKKLNANFKNMPYDEYKAQYDIYDKEWDKEKEIYDTLHIPIKQWSALSDMYDAMTTGEFLDDFELAGHGKKYYSNYKTKEMELLANYVSLSVFGQEQLQIFKNDFPKVVEALDKVVDSLNRNLEA